MVGVDVQDYTRWVGSMKVITLLPMMALRPRSLLANAAIRRGGHIIATKAPSY